MKAVHFRHRLNDNICSLDTGTMPLVPVANDKKDSPLRNEEPLLAWKNLCVKTVAEQKILLHSITGRVPKNAFVALMGTLLLPSDSYFNVNQFDLVVALMSTLFLIVIYAKQLDV